MLRADQFHLPPSPASGCQFTFQWLYQGCMWGKRIISKRVKPAAILLGFEVCLELKQPFFDSIHLGRCTASELQRGPQLGIASMHKGTASSSTQPPGESQIESSFSLKSSFREAHLCWYRKSCTTWGLPCESPGQGG